MKHYVIDGLNLIHKSHFLKSKLSFGKKIAVDSLIELIRQLSASFPTFKFIIFIDGIKEQEVFESASIKVKFSGKSNTADESIKKYIIENHQKLKLSVVSSDTEVYNFSRIHACETILSEEFSNKFNTSKNSTNKSNPRVQKEKPIGVSKKNINELKKIFEDNPLDDFEY